MAEITLGVGTSHGPLLNTPPEQWGQRADADRRSRGLIYRGEAYAFDDLIAARGRRFEAECAAQERQRRHRACREAITEVGRVLTGTELDALVVISSDHKEIFDDRILPPFAFYWGDSVDHVPYTQQALDAMAPGLAIAEVANVPDVATVRQCHSRLALHLIQQISARGFDPAASKELPAGKFDDHGIPHGWGFVYQQLLGGSTSVPIVPLFVNTFWEPNPPSAQRCYDFGVALGEAICGFDDDARVGVVASGGLSHFVVDEELDTDFLTAVTSDDRDFLVSLDAKVLRSGTSELRNWILLAGALSGNDLVPKVVEYQPCYRSEAGTGCAMGFVTWQRRAA